MAQIIKKGWKVELKGGDHQGRKQTASKKFKKLF